MKIAYEAANSIEGHMMVDYLKMHGISAFLLGEHLQSGAGQLPVAGLVKVHVNDVDWVRAREIIEAWNAQQLDTDSEQITSPIDPHSSRTKYVAAFISGLLLGATLSNCQLRVPNTLDYYPPSDSSPDMRYSD